MIVAVAVVVDLRIMDGQGGVAGRMMEKGEARAVWEVQEAGRCSRSAWDSIRTARGARLPSAAKSRRIAGPSDPGQ